MNNKLEQAFETMRDAQKEQLLETIDPEIVMKNGSKDRIAAKLEKKLPKKRSFAKVWRPVAIAAAACAVIYLTLGFTVPGVADGLYRIAHPDHVTEQYFASAPNDRESVQEIDSAVREAEGKNLGSDVELLGEYSILTQYDEEYNAMLDGSPTYREKLGFPAYRAEDFAFLREIRITDTEVYYNGEALYVNCFLACPDTSRFLNGRDDELEISTFWQILSRDGEEIKLPCSSSMGGATEVIDEPDKKGLWCSSMYELDEPLSDGAYEMTLLYYVYDCSIDDMAAPGNVGRIIHRVSFDTTAGNRSEKQTVETTVRGSAPLTFFVYGEDGKTMENRTVSFDGLDLAFILRYLPDGTYLTVKTTSLPETWTDAERKALLDHMLRAVDVDLIIEGEPIEGRNLSSSYERDAAAWEFFFPVVSQDYSGVKTIDLLLKIRSVEAFTAYLGEDENGRAAFGEPVHPGPDGGAVACPEVWIMKEIRKTALWDSIVTVTLP